MTGSVVSGNGLEPGYANMLMTEHSANGTVLVSSLQQQPQSDIMGSTYVIHPTSEHGDTNLLLGAPMANYVTDQPTYVLATTTSAASVMDMPAILDSYSNATTDGESCANIYPQTVYSDEPFNYTNRGDETACVKQPLASASSVSEDKENEKDGGEATEEASGSQKSPAPVAEGRSPSATSTGSPTGPTAVVDNTTTDSTCQ